MSFNSANIVSFPTVASLQAVSASASLYANVYVYGINSFFYWSPLSVASSNGTTVIAVTGVTTGRYLITNPVMSIQELLSGSSATYTRPVGVRQIRVCLQAGGAGGSGVSTVAGTVVSGTVGNNTSFNSIVATGGVAGSGFSGGGVTTAGTGSASLRAQGGSGNGGNNGTFNANGSSGGNGGVSYYGGAGNGAVHAAGSNVGGNAADNSGSGGGGAYNNSAGNSGPGGGSGEYVEFLINSPAATYTFTVAGTAAGGASSSNGGVGGSGRITVYEYY